jgi:hypothetical protein
MEAIYGMTNGRHVRTLTAPPRRLAEGILSELDGQESSEARHMASTVPQCGVTRTGNGPAVIAETNENDTGTGVSFTDPMLRITPRRMLMR